MLINPHIMRTWLKRRKIDSLMVVGPGEIHYDVYLQDNFTIVLLSRGTDLRFGIGVTKREPRDSNDFSRAIRIATWRALDFAFGVKR